MQKHDEQSTIIKFLHSCFDNKVKAIQHTMSSSCRQKPYIWSNLDKIASLYSGKKKKCFGFMQIVESHHTGVLIQTLFAISSLKRSVMIVRAIMMLVIGAVIAGRGIMKEDSCCCCVITNTLHSDNRNQPVGQLICSFIS